MDDRPANECPTEKALTPQNLALAAQTIGGLTQAYDGLVQGADLPENAAFRHILLERARDVYHIAKRLDSGSPI